VAHIRLLSFNIRGGKNLRGKRSLPCIRNLIDRLDVDIAVFQEVDTRPSRGGSSEDIAAIVGPERVHQVRGPSIIEDGGWYGNLIASRFPIIRGTVHNLETKSDMEPRNAVDALIETPFGKIRLIGTHLSLSMFERWWEARNLLRLMKSVEEQERNPLFLMGDINEWQYPSRLLRFLNSVMHPLPCGATFPSFFPVFHLDRIWYDAPQLKVTAHRVATRDVRLISDHLPLVVEVDFNP
jgi:endonuclease/exonuclease/phosphatase family metal-dependent hydrolase